MVSFQKVWCGSLTLTHEALFLIPFLFNCPRCIVVLQALDDETEDVLDCLTAQGDELLISVLTHAGLRSIFPQARWQCAELLGRRSIPDGMALLRQYANDRDAYVAKRARNAMKAITGNKNG